MIQEMRLPDMNLSHAHRRVKAIAPERTLFFFLNRKLYAIAFQFVQNRRRACTC